MDVLTRKEMIRKVLVADVENSAEMTFSDDEGLFHIDMTPYPYLKKYFEESTDVTIEKGFLNSSFDKLHKDITLDYSFSYTYGDYDSKVETAVGYVDKIMPDLEEENNYDEDEYDKVYNAIEAENKAFDTVLADTIKKQISYYQDIKGAFEDTDNPIPYSGWSKDTKNYYDNAIDYVQAEVESGLQRQNFDIALVTVRDTIESFPEIINHQKATIELRALNKKITQSQATQYWVHKDDDFVAWINGVIRPYTDTEVLVDNKTLPMSLKTQFIIRYTYETGYKCDVTSAPIMYEHLVKEIHNFVKNEDLQKVMLKEFKERYEQLGNHLCH